MYIHELPEVALKKMKQCIRVALALNPVTVLLHALTAPVEKVGKDLVDTEVYSMQCTLPLGTLI